MANLNISLPEKTKELIDGLVAKGMFKGPDDYIRVPVQRDWQERERESIAAARIKGLDSGPSTLSTARDRAEIGREGMERLATRNAQ